MSKITPSLQDFSLINTSVAKIKEDLEFDTPSNAFYFFVMDYILELNEDEIRDSITDTHFLKSSNQIAGHDRGIDAVYIDDSASTATIHFFNFKYTSEFKKTNNTYPSSEIDKILSFLKSLMSQDEYLTEDVNPILYSKCKEIWKIFEAQNPNFIIHICGNCYNKFEINEEKRFQREIKKYSNFEIQYHLLPELVDLVTSSTKKEINAKIMGIDQRFFEKTGGNIRALIFEIDAKDLIRIVLDNDEIRNATDLDEKGYESLKHYKILEDVFEDNVRVYDKKSKINRSIVETATSEDNENFFYYNNGITITCNHLSYSKRRSPIIELKKIQVVNGSQTIHALYEAFLKDSSKFENVELLCRIYETQALELSTKIAEYTNSQNPVKSRDVRSVDYIQQKLEKELLVKGYFYERKRNQYSSKSRQLRLDAEKVGQTLMAFYNQLPYEAKNRKRFIFGDKYDEVFNDETTADKILLSYRLFEKIESQKQETKKNIINDTTKFSEKSYILYASYYILHIIGELAQQQAIDLTLSNIEKIWQLYKKAIEYLEKIIEKEKKQSQNKYAHASFFRSNKPKKYFEEIMEKENN